MRIAALIPILEPQKRVPMKRISAVLLVFFALMNSANAQADLAIEAYNQGISQFNNKDLKAAIVSFDKAILLDSTLMKSWFNRAVCKADLNDYSGAIADYSAFIRKDTSGLDRAYFSRAQAYYLNKNKDEALADYLKAGNLNTSNAEAFYYAGGI